MPGAALIPSKAWRFRPRVQSPSPRPEHQRPDKLGKAKSPCLAACRRSSEQRARPRPFARKSYAPQTEELWSVQSLGFRAAKQHSPISHPPSSSCRLSGLLGLCRPLLGLLGLWPTAAPNAGLSADLEADEEPRGLRRGFLRPWLARAVVMQPRAKTCKNNAIRAALRAKLPGMSPCP